jgi:hypothetical protein
LFTNGGLLTSNGLSTFTSSTNTASGQIIANGIVETADFLNNGVLTINGGSTLHNYNSNFTNGGGSRTTVNAGGAINLNGTQLNLNGALLVNNGTITGGAVNVYYGSLAKGTGAYGVVNVFDGGIYAPGSSPGISTASAVTFDNAPFTSGGPALQIEIAGTAEGTLYDRLHVTGQLSLGGTLQVALTNGFSPAAGNSFDILNWGSLAGTFAALQLPALDEGLSWNTSQLYSDGVLTVAATGFPGDFNHDDTVDAADYVVWRKAIGVAPTPDNYNLWQINFARTLIPGSSTVAPAFDGVPPPSRLDNPIPEPPLLSFLALAVAGSIGRRRRAPFDGRRSTLDGLERYAPPPNITSY